MLRDVETYIPNVTFPRAKDLNTLGDVVRLLNNSNGPDGFRDSSSLNFRRPIVPETIVARLTADLGGGTYEWVEVYPSVGVGYVEMVDGRTSETAGLAVETTFTSTHNADPDDGDVVVMRRRSDLTDGTPLWVIAGGGSLDFYNGATLVQTNAPKLSVDSATANVLHFLASSMGGSGGDVTLSLVGSTDGTVLQVSGGGYAFDHVRFTA